VAFGVVGVGRLTVGQQAGQALAVVGRQRRGGIDEVDKRA
jgi:hypothetical protein